MLVSSGQKLSKAITSHDWNDVQAMLREFRNGRLSFGADGSNSPYVASVVWVKNTSANDVEPGDVLGLGNPVTTPTNNANEFKSFLAFEGSIPSTSTPHYGQYAVCQEAARKTDGFCRAVVMGLTFAKLSITHAADLYCEITNSVSTYLTTSALGSSRILWKDSGTGSSNKWGLIRVGEPSGEILVYNNTGSSINNASGTFQVHTGTPGSESSTGQTITAFSKYEFKTAKYGSAAILQKGNAYASPQQT